eukprot:scaffold10983_cov130-Isochrysis_galbana.AAC.2
MKPLQARGMLAPRSCAWRGRAPHPTAPAHAPSLAVVSPSEKNKTPKGGARELQIRRKECVRESCTAPKLKAGSRSPRLACAPPLHNPATMRRTHH